MTRIAAMQPVQSSNIEKIGYDPPTRALRVRFKGGGTYEHKDVPPEKHEALMRAESKGAFYAREIKGAHPSSKVS